VGEKKVTSYRNLTLNLDLEVKPSLTKDEKNLVDSFEGEGRITIIEFGYEDSRLVLIRFFDQMGVLQTIEDYAFDEISVGMGMDYFLSCYKRYTPSNSINFIKESV
jgi:hypothetical protein